MHDPVIGESRGAEDLLGDAHAELIALGGGGEGAVVLVQLAELLRAPAAPAVGLEVLPANPASVVVADDLGCQVCQFGGRIRRAQAERTSVIQSQELCGRGVEAIPDRYDIAARGLHPTLSEVLDLLRCNHEAKLVIFTVDLVPIGFGRSARWVGACEVAVLGDSAVVPGRRVGAILVEQRRVRDLQQIALRAELRRPPRRCRGRVVQVLDAVGQNAVQSSTHPAPHADLLQTTQLTRISREVPVEHHGSGGLAVIGCAGRQAEMDARQSGNLVSRRPYLQIAVDFAAAVDVGRLEQVARERTHIRTIVGEVGGVSAGFMESPHISVALQECLRSHRVAGEVLRARAGRSPFGAGTASHARVSAALATAGSVKPNGVGERAARAIGLIHNDEPHRRSGPARAQHGVPARIGLAAVAPYQFEITRNKADIEINHGLDLGSRGVADRVASAPAWVDRKTDRPRVVGCGRTSTATAPAFGAPSAVTACISAAPTPAAAAV